MSDVSILLPLPTTADMPVLSAVAPLVDGAWFQGFVDRGDLGPKDGSGFTFHQFQIVALRFDVCDRSAVGPCPPGVEGRLRLIGQPIQPIAGMVQAVDVACHLFYPIPAGDLPGVIDELRALAAIQDAPADDPLDVSPAASADDPEYLTRLRSLVLRYATPDHLVRLTVAGQVGDDAAFTWVFRELDRTGTSFVQTPIPQIDAIQQQTLVAGGNVIYTTTPRVADDPVGFALAVNGADWLAASPDNRLLAIDALAQIQNPTLRDAVNTQCVACHVATYLTTTRAADLPVDPSTAPSWYHTTRNVAVKSLANMDPRVVRNFGWVGTSPVVSQRIANDTAHTLDDIDAQFPPGP